ILESRIFSLFVKPSLGGMIAEIDFKPRSIHTTNIISRRKEAYHSKISNASGNGDEHAASIHERTEAKEQGLEKLLLYDPYRHGCLIEHLLPEKTSFNDLSSMRFYPLESFVTSPYEWSWNNGK